MNGYNAAENFCIIKTGHNHLLVLSEIDLLLTFTATNPKKQVLELFKIKLLLPTTREFAFLRICFFQLVSYLFLIYNRFQ